MVRDSDHMVRPIGRSPFLFPDPNRLPVPEVIAAPAVFGGVQGYDAFAASPLFHPNHRIAGEPVVGMDDVEWADVVFGLKHMVHERPAHVVDFVYEVRVQVKRAAMIMDAVDSRIMELAMSHAGEHMYLVTFPLHSGRQLGNVHTHTAYCNRMQRFPGKHCDSHDTYRRRVEDKTDYLTGNAGKICVPQEDSAVRPICCDRQ